MVNDSKVFIRNIPFDCRESDLLNFFHGFGPIREIVLKNNYGFCTFQDYYDAREAVKETDGRRLLGVRVSVEMARGEFFRQEGAHSWHHNTTGVIKGDKATVFLGNLPPFCRELDIENFFNGYGSLRKIVIKRTFGFVEFEDLKDAEEAVKELTGRKLRGERITLEFAKHDKKTAAHSKKIPDYVPGLFRMRVENLCQQTAWQDLKDFMKQAGEVVFCKAHHEEQGVGMVEFLRKEDMVWAIKNLDQAKLAGRRLQLSQEVE